MTATTYKEKNELNDINFTPLKNEILNGEEVIDLSSNQQPISFEQGVDHTPSPELLEYVQSTPGVIDVGDLNKIGVNAVDSTGFRNFEAVTLPLSDDKINDGLKKPIGSSFRWLAEFTKALFLRRKVQTA